MPTGYTADVQDGKITEFRDFALQCARAFGALVVMRDSVADAEIPKQFEPHTSYHDENLDKARRVLAELATMTADECINRSLDEYKNAVARWHERENTRAVQRGRYEAMLAKVLAWSPPSPDHVELRDFMAKQLQQSIEFDCSSKFDTAPERLSPAEWAAQRRAIADRDIAYHTVERAKEVARTEERNRWVAQLRKSLNGNRA